MFNKINKDKLIKGFDYDKFYYQYVDAEMEMILASHYFEFYNQIEETERQYVKYTIVFQNGRFVKGRRIDPSCMMVEKTTINKNDENDVKTERLYRDSYDENLMKIYKDIYNFFEKDSFREIKCKEFLEMLIDYYNMYFESGNKYKEEDDNPNDNFTFTQLFDWRDDIIVY